MKQHLLLNLILISIIFSFILRIHCETSTTATATISSTSSSISGDDGNTQAQKTFLLKSWAKFFSYVLQPGFIDEPTHFQINEAYYIQQQQDVTKNAQKAKNGQATNQQAAQDSSSEKDDFGSLNIPSQNHFFFVLTKKSVYAVSARKNDLAKTVKSLEINWLEAVNRDKNGQLVGGVEDIGNFKEGFCIRLKSKTKAVWNMCFDNLGDKSNWMTTLESLLPQISGAGGNYLSQVPQEEVLPFKVNFNTKQQTNDDPTTRKDGIWMIIQDWSQCTLACGGGKQYQQRICIPPKNGGKQCVGQTILERECNKNPCPNVIEQKQDVEGDAKFKILKISNRYQRYEQCVVKEEDLNLCISNSNMRDCIQFPSRVVLNNKTLTIFTQPQYDSIYKSFDLKYILISKDPKKKACFKVIDERDQSKNIDLCIMPEGLKRTQSYDDKINEWIHDIDDFTHRCQTKKIKHKLDPKIQQKMMQLEQEQKRRDMEDVLNQDERIREISIEQQVQQTANQAIKAVQKELKFEELAIKEEKMKEKEEELLLQQQLEKMKDRKECLERELKQKEKLQALQQQNSEMKRKIVKIQETAKTQIQSSRVEIKNKIEAMRRQAERRRKELRGKMQVIRTKMLDTLLQENKKGDMRKCVPSQPKMVRDDYCDKIPNDIDNAQAKVDCKISPADFCSVCCGNEFGRMLTQERTDCNAMCFEDGDNSKNTWINVKSNSKVLKEIQ